MYSEKAVELFHQGYNCSQSVAYAFKDIIKMDDNTLLSISSAFGGGFCRLRQTCGALSGIAIVLGYIEKYTDPNDYDKKVELYTIYQELAKKFEEKHGYLDCKSLLGGNPDNSPIPSKRTKNFYNERPCERYIHDAAEILENYLKKSGVI